MNTYTIKTVNDLLKIPADRRRLCLDEIACACDLVELKRREIAQAYPWWLRWLARPTLGQFTWVDDGKRSETISFEGKVIYHKE